MDAAAFLQENKRWLAGCAAGALVWLVAAAVVNSIYDPAAVAASPRKLGAPTTPVFDRPALDAAREEHAALEAERRRLVAELAFTPSPRYQLGRGAPDEYLFQVGRDLKQAIQTSARERDVLLGDGNVAWEVPSGVDEIKAVLLGLDVLDELQQRLFAAHDATMARDPQALGLRAILALKLETRRNTRQARRPPRAGEPDLRELFDQERVAFHFQADEPTLSAFLESCRRPPRTLVVESWQVLQPARAGDTCTVKGTLSGIVFREEPQ